MLLESYYLFRLYFDIYLSFCLIIIDFLFLKIMISFNLTVVIFTCFWNLLWRNRYKTNVLLLWLSLSLFLLLIWRKLYIMLWLDLFHCHLLKFFTTAEFFTCLSFYLTPAFKHKWVLFGIICLIYMILRFYLMALMFIYRFVHKRFRVTFYRYIFPGTSINGILSGHQLLNNQTK